MLHFGISTSYWPIGFLSSILFFLQTLAYPLSLSSFSTRDDDDDYDHGSLSSSSPSSFSDSFGSTFNLDEDAKFSFALLVTISSAKIQTLADFSPTEPLSFCREKHSFSTAFCFMIDHPFSFCPSGISLTLLISLFLLYLRLASDCSFRSRVSYCLYCLSCHGFDIYTTLWFCTDSRSSPSCSGYATS